MKKSFLLIGILLFGLICVACMRGNKEDTRMTISEKEQMILHKRIENENMTNLKKPPKESFANDEEIKIPAMKSLMVNNYGFIETMNISSEEIEKIFYSYQYEGWEFILCLDINGSYHVACKKEGVLTSLIEFSDIEAYLSTDDEQKELNGFEAFEHILGSSGVRLRQVIGASCIMEVYIAVKEDMPEVILSTSSSGELVVYDIDKDGQNELLSLMDGYFYDENESGVWLLKFTMDKTYKQLIFNEDKGCYELIDQDGIIHDMEYRSKVLCLIAKEEIQ